jgi:hypothetical protein
VWGFPPPVSWRHSSSLSYHRQPAPPPSPCCSPNNRVGITGIGRAMR